MCSRHVHTPDFRELYVATSSLDMSRMCLRYQIGMPTQDKSKKIETYYILCANSLIYDSYETCLPRARSAWEMCVRCPSIQHFYKPDINSGPSTDREDPRTNPRLTLLSRFTYMIYSTSLDLRVIMGEITIHPPTQPLCRAKKKSARPRSTMNSCASAFAELSDRPTIEPNHDQKPDREHNTMHNIYPGKSNLTRSPTREIHPTTPTFVLSCALRSTPPGFLSGLVFFPQAMQMQMQMRMHTGRRCEKAKVRV